MYIPACVILSFNGTNLSVDLRPFKSDFDTNNEPDIDEIDAEIEQNNSIIYYINIKAITAKKWSSEITCMIAEILGIHTKNANYDEDQAHFQMEELKDEHADYFRVLEVDWRLHTRSKGQSWLPSNYVIIEQS